VGWAAKSVASRYDELPVLLLRTARRSRWRRSHPGGRALLALRSASWRAQRDASMALYYPRAGFSNALRGVDPSCSRCSFVAAVGPGLRGPSSGSRSTPGAARQALAEAIENIPPGPLEAAAATGLAREGYRYALFPDVAPAWSRSGSLVEFNVRASTVLGVVGAGGIVQELKNSMDLLLFPSPADDSSC